MSKEFFTTHKIYLTPLSPLHIGTGEDLIPTNYWIDKGMMYVFDPMSVKLPPEQLALLKKLARDPNFCHLYGFFKEYKNLFKPYISSVIPVDSDVEKKYNETINNIKVPKNRCLISRTSILNIDGYEQPFIPGSSLKGAFHTAWLETIAKKKKLQLNAKDVIKGKVRQLDNLIFNLNDTFNKSPMRLLKISDLLPSTDVYSRVIKTEKIKTKIKKTEEKNKPSTNNKQTQIENKYEIQIPSFVEVIDYAQYRAFTGTINIVIDEHSDVSKEAVINGVNSLTDSMKKFYEDKTKFGELYDTSWKSFLDKLKNELGANSNNGKDFIVSVGKFQGNKNITLNAANKKIAKSFNLAEERGKQGNVINLPFGLALVEIDPEGENKALKTFCDACHSTMPDFKLAQLRQ